MINRLRIFLVSVSMAVTAGCATVPEPLRGEFPELAPLQSEGLEGGETVRWGGEILKVDPGKDVTCFEILSRALDTSARPITSDRTLGRFIACSSGFFDPAVFETGRDITVVGRFSQFDVRKLGDYEYRYPIIEADVIYLWSVESERPAYYYPRHPFFDPWWPWP